jgi:hypothetical protein
MYEPVMNEPGLDFLWPAAAKRASALPTRLGTGTGTGNATFWDDICDVLLDPEPDPRAAETVRRWLREEVEQDLRRRLKQGNARHLAAWACRLAPRMTWKLPSCSTNPPPRFHRRIVAILLPHKLKLLERELTRLAFSWQFRPVARPVDRDDVGGADRTGFGGEGP